MDQKARIWYRGNEWESHPFCIERKNQLKLEKEQNDLKKVMKTALSNLPNIIEICNKNYSNYPIIISKELFNFIFKNHWENRPYTYLEHRIIISPILEPTKVSICNIEFDLCLKYLK